MQQRLTWLAVAALALLASGALAGPLDGVTVCLDPGHPSENGGGATGSGGAKEYEVVWQVAQKLAPLLREAGAKVVLTKSSAGEKVTNRRRAEIGNESGAGLVVRLHCDSGGNSGYALYYPDQQGLRCRA